MVYCNRNKHKLSATCDAILLFGKGFKILLSFNLVVQNVFFSSLEAVLKHMLETKLKEGSKLLYCWSGVIQLSAGIFSNNTWHSGFLALITSMNFKVKQLCDSSYIFSKGLVR